MNEQAFAQAMDERDLGDMWENMQVMAPNFAQAFARELLEEDEDFIWLNGSTICSTLWSKYNGLDADRIWAFELKI